MRGNGAQNRDGDALRPDSPRGCTAHDDDGSPSEGPLRRTGAGWGRGGDGRQGARDGSGEFLLVFTSVTFVLSGMSFVSLSLLPCAR